MSLSGKSGHRKSKLPCPLLEAFLPRQPIAVEAEIDPYASVRDRQLPHCERIVRSPHPRGRASGSGTVRPSALAVLRLMINSTFVSCCTGKSAGFSPLRMRPV